MYLLIHYHLVYTFCYIAYMFNSKVHIYISFLVIYFPL